MSRFARSAAALVVATLVSLLLPAASAAADTGGTLRAHATDVSGQPLAGICIDLLNPGGTNTAPSYVLETAPSDLTGLITQKLITPGTYDVFFRDCGNVDPNYVSRFYGSTSLDEAKATPVTIVEGRATTIGHTAIDLGGTVSGVLTDPATAQPAVNVSVTAWTAGHHLLAELYANPTCTDDNGRFSIAALPTSGVKLEFAQAPYYECGGDLPFDDRFYPEVKSYDSAHVISFPPDGTADASTTLTRAFNTVATITSVGITGTVDAPTFTVRGTGFKSRPSGTATACQTETGDDGLVYDRGVLYLVDESGGWAAGYGGDCIGLIIQTWTSSKIVFAFGAWYQQVGEPVDGIFLSPGDDIALTVKGTTVSETVTYGG